MSLARPEPETGPQIGTDVDCRNRISVTEIVAYRGILCVWYDSCRTSCHIFRWAGIQLGVGQDPARLLASKVGGRTARRPATSEEHDR
jgi:hypothetical protein